MAARKNIPHWRKRFDDGWMPVTESGCWIWMRGCDADGYGRLSIKNKSYTTHRLSWQMSRGEVPRGLSVLHHCDVPACVNPEHLFLGTHDDNMRDRSRRDRYGRHGQPAVGAVCVGGRWHARHAIGGKLIYIGSFPTKDEATAAYHRALASLDIEKPAAWNAIVIKCCCVSWQCTPDEALARLSKGTPGRKLKIDDGCTNYDIKEIRAAQLDIEVNSATFGDAT